MASLDCAPIAVIQGAESRITQRCLAAFVTSLVPELLNAVLIEFFADDVEVRGKAPGVRSAVDAKVLPLIQNLGCGAWPIRWSRKP